MKWLKVYGLPRLPLFLAKLAMRLGLPGPTWYKWKAAAAGTGVILDEMIRAADDLGYDGQKVAKLAMSRIGEKQGTDLREQLGVGTMKDTVDVVMLANRFFDIEITLTETKDGEYVINAEADPSRDAPYVRANQIADVGDLVDKADLGRKEGVCGVFDHLRARQIRDDERHRSFGPRVYLRRKGLLDDWLI